jgi:ribonuclease J
MGHVTVYPRFDVLDTGVFNLRGVLITHAHEDHIGGLARLLARFDVPVYAPAYAAGVLQHKAHEHSMLEHARIQVFDAGARLRVGSFEVEAAPVTHSVPDAHGFAIQTSVGRIVHTGDFKLDPTPPVGSAFDPGPWERWGRDGVALLLSDSTNAEARGHSASEATVEAALDRAIADATGTVYVGLFASNVHRLELLGRIAQRYRRRLFLAGRSMETHARVAARLGLLSWSDAWLEPRERAGSVPPAERLVLMTGSQAEAESGLWRLAHHTHPSFHLERGDTVVLSSRIIPGNEEPVQELIDRLWRGGAHVVHAGIEPGVHVSGHAYQEEQRRVLQWTAPAAFLPVHGARRHMEAHAATARAEGVSQVAVIENGTSATLGRTPHGVALEVGDTFVSGAEYVQLAQGGRRDPEAFVLAPEVLQARERVMLAGLVVVEPRSATRAAACVTLVGLPEVPGLAVELERELALIGLANAGGATTVDVHESAVRRVFRRRGLPRPLVRVLANSGEA